MKQVNKLIVKVPRTRRRADFLFHGPFKPKCEQNQKAYDRKKLAKPDLDIY